MRCVVTGGAGFIGSHLADRLIEEGHEVFVIDNLSSGLKENINEKAIFLKRDIRKDLSLELEAADALFHLAADPDVRSSASEPSSSFDINVSGTFTLLESCRKADVKRLIFTSSSSVYGEASVLPTPETYPCAPISNYAASKLACEAYISSYAHSYSLKSSVLRLANIFGERGRRGVMFDFYNKLKKDPKRLEILGDGNQEKSYLHVSDCVSAMMIAWKRQEKPFDIFNIGSKEAVKVSAIAQEISKTMQLNPRLEATGTLGGWVGDINKMFLDTRKIQDLGWEQKTNFQDGIRGYIQSLSQK